MALIGAVGRGAQLDRETRICRPESLELPAYHLAFAAEQAARQRQHSFARAAAAAGRGQDGEGAGGQRTDAHERPRHRASTLPSRVTPPNSTVVRPCSGVGAAAAARHGTSTTTSFEGAPRPVPFTDLTRT